MAVAVDEAVERYLALPYRIVLYPDDGEWVVAMPELPGCLSQRTTEAEALAMIREAQRGWIAARLAHGLPIPDPEEAEEHRYTGRFGVRIPKEVHRARR